MTASSLRCQEPELEQGKYICPLFSLFFLGIRVGKINPSPFPYENFKTATTDWVLLMTKLKTDPTYTGITLLAVKSKLSLSLALSTTPKSN